VIVRECGRSEGARDGAAGQGAHGPFTLRIVIDRLTAIPDVAACRASFMKRQSQRFVETVLLFDTLVARPSPVSPAELEGQRV